MAMCGHGAGRFDLGNPVARKRATITHVSKVRSVLLLGDFLEFGDATANCVIALDKGANVAAFSRLKLSQLRS
jgi:hypothetical protein